MDSMNQQQFNLDRLLKESDDVRQFLLNIRDKARLFEAVEGGFNSNKMAYAFVLLLEKFMKQDLASFESDVAEEKRVLNNSFEVGSQIAKI